MPPRGDQPAAARPDVAVVVIAYNDAERLPTAVESVLDQTLDNVEIVIVDDASTDGSADVARELARRGPAIRAITLPENSGGCSRPRNVGLDVVTAPYVMFLDSDDVLERHACKNLLLAAERTGADLVSGRCVRVNPGRLVGPRKQPQRTPWMSWLYQEHAVYGSIRDCPDLLFDTLCTNKLYRSDFLRENNIRFPEGLHYEDLLFTAEVYCSARSIALIPEEVYRWMVVEDADRESISRQLARLKNFEDRLEIHRRIDAYLLAHGHGDLKPYKDRKFLRAELKLYLGQLRERDASYQQQWLDLAADYLDTVDPAAWEICGPVPRAAGFLVRARDLEGALGVAELWIRDRLAIDLTPMNGRVYLGSRHLDTEAGRAALDVTGLHLHTAPHSHANLFNRLVALEGSGTQLRLTGEITNLVGRITDHDEVSLRLSLRRRGSGSRVDVAADRLEVGPRVIRWSVTVDAARQLPPLQPNAYFLDVVALLEWHGAVNQSVLSADAAVVGTVAVGTGRGQARVAGDTLRAYVTRNGNLAFRLEASTAVFRYSAKALRYARRSRAARWTRRVRRLPQRRELKAFAYRHVFRRLPIRPHTAVFESHIGRSYSDSPKYVFEQVRRDHPQLRCVWSVTAGGRGWPTDVPQVRRDSWRYYYELARAGYWVDNQGFPAIATRRPGTTYLQTWHGSPLKVMGFDEPRFMFGSEQRRRDFARGVGRWTHYVVQSPFAEDAFDHAFRHQAENLRTGYPRNDRLITDNHAEKILELKQRLELPTDRRIVLYTPTFRDYLKTLGRQFRLPLTLASLAEDVGDQWFFLVRAHYLDKVRISGRVASFARDVSGHHDITDLLLVADALITDYSSVMFDYALLRRPMLFYTYDFDLYRLSRGTYFDLAAEAPGPLVSTREEVADWLKNVDAVHRRYKDKQDAFIKKFAAFEHGTAARDVVHSVFGPPRP